MSSSASAGVGAGVPRRVPEGGAEGGAEGGPEGGADVGAIRRARARFARVLTGWSVGSVVVGLPLWFGTGSELLGAMGSQFAIWGAIDLVFGVMGLRQSAEAGRGKVDDVSEAMKLRGTLRVSHKINVASVGVGLGLVGWAVISGGGGLWGHAVGVTVQAAFLLIYDSFFARALDAAMRSGGDGRGA